MKRHLWKAVLATAVVLLAALVAGCPSSDPSAGATRVHLLLTDAPIDLSAVSAVNVTISEYVLYPAGNGNGEGSGIVMAAPGADTATINLLDYQNGQVVLVASVDVPEGSYERIRLRIDAAELLRDDDGDPATPDIAEPIKVPSGKVDVPVPFTVTAGEEMEVTLDFDAQASVQVNATSGNHPYILRPVIKPVSVRAR